MANGYSRQIQERIGTAAEGTVFVGSDFADIADTETIRRNLNRLTQVLSGKLNDVPSGRLFRADLGFLQMCQSL